MAKLYKITSPSGKVSYLFGTIHKNENAFCLLSEEAKQAFEEAKIVVGEQTYEDYQQFIAQLPTKLLSWWEAQKSSNSIIDYLTYSQIKQLSTLFNLDQMSFENIKNQFDVPPIFLFHKVSTSLLDENKHNPNTFFENSNGLVLDLALMFKAQQIGKKCMSLDSIEEKLSFIIGQSLSFEQQVQYWKDCFDGTFDLEKVKEKYTSAFEKMTKLYLSGDIENIEEAIQKSISDSAVKKEYIKTICLDKREELFVKRLEPILNEDKSFVTMGFLHLLGVTRLLKERNFIIEPIIETNKQYVINEMKNTNVDIQEERLISYFTQISNGSQEAVYLHSVDEWNSYQELLSKNKFNSNKPIFLTIKQSFLNGGSGSLSESDCEQIKKLLFQADNKIYGMDLKFADLSEKTAIDLLKAIHNKALTKFSLDLTEWPAFNLPIVKYLNEFVDTYSKDGSLDIRIPYVYHPEVKMLRDKIEKLSIQYHNSSKRYY